MWGEGDTAQPTMGRRPRQRQGRAEVLLGTASERHALCVPHPVFVPLMRIDFLSTVLGGLSWSFDFVFFLAAFFSPVAPFKPLLDTRASATSVSDTSSNQTSSLDDAAPAPFASPPEASGLMRRRLDS